MLVLGIAAGLITVFLAAGFGRLMDSSEPPGAFAVCVQIVFILLMQTIAMALAYWAGGL